MHIIHQYKVFACLYFFFPFLIHFVFACTNIFSETAITIDEIRFVIDTGKLKETTFESSTGIKSLKEYWISKVDNKFILSNRLLNKSDFIRY